ncbi:MAG: hypothetical protein H0U74_17805 [Bradymonadaceae bacterium]|nr:hypothetical protein [Lujinxingiaceae bacterium]
MVEDSVAFCSTVATGCRCYVDLQVFDESSGTYTRNGGVITFTEFYTKCEFYTK